MILLRITIKWHDCNFHVQLDESSEIGRLCAFAWEEAAS